MKRKIVTLIVLITFIISGNGFAYTLNPLTRTQNETEVSNSTETRETRRDIRRKRAADHKEFIRNKKARARALRYIRVIKARQLLKHLKRHSRKVLRFKRKKAEDSNLFKRRLTKNISVRRQRRLRNQSPENQGSWSIFVFKKVTAMIFTVPKFLVKFLP